MTTISVTDPFNLNIKKLHLEKLLLAAIAKNFPNHRIGSRHYIHDDYPYYVEGAGCPSHTYDISKNVKETSFCIIAPKLPDNRKKFGPWLIGEPSAADVLCVVEIIYSANELNVIQIQFKVFGTQNKDAFLKLANDIATDGILGLYIQSIVVSIESEDPEKERLF